ncbi:amino acid racemase [Sphingomonas sp.]|uniref:aspartate/glutamate racemase family protein n=1 Tax=Sphingomonas sp. TaxID=28214 RepID=UPI00286D19FE|nr:amino acid racemase [Sphingomonas sp.]
MRKLGIVGGTSWSSTALYYEHINRGIAKRLGALHSARLAIESLDLAPIAEMELSGDWEGVAAALIEAARKLKSSGAQGVLLASNTSHKVYEEVRAAVRLPMLHIAEPTADRLVADGRTRVALLGTRFTMNEGHFRDRIEARGIKIAAIDAGWVKEVDRIIFEELAAGRVVRDSQRKLKTLITELAKQKVQAVVLACTELVMAVDVRANVIPVYDTTALHAHAAVDWMLDDAEEAKAAA